MKDLILVTGSEGMIGSRFIELYPEKNEVHTPRQIDFDITDKNQVKALIASYEFKAVVHFAAFTDVDEAEKQRGKKELSCWQVNVEGTKNLIEAMEPRKDKIHFIHISTDMVFSGLAEDPGPYSENHPAEGPRAARPGGEAPEARRGAAGPGGTARRQTLILHSQRREAVGGRGKGHKGSDPTSTSGRFLWRRKFSRRRSGAWSCGRTGDD